MLPKTLTFPAPLFEAKKTSENGVGRAQKSNLAIWGIWNFKFGKLLQKGRGEGQSLGNIGIYP